MLPIHAIKKFRQTDRQTDDRPVDRNTDRHLKKVMIFPNEYDCENDVWQIDRQAGRKGKQAGIFDIYQKWR